MNGAADRHLTLLVPGLLGPAIEPGGERAAASRMLCEGLAVPALERLLSRAARSHCALDDDSPEALACASFGVARDGGDWPVAALTLLDDGGTPGEQWWLRADPVHLRADMGDATLFAASELELGDGDEAALAAEVGGYVTEQGLSLEARGKARWYLRGAPVQVLSTWPLSVVAGAAVGERLPHGADAARWRVLGNEIQMLLHASVVNRRREAAGLAPVNGVWLWGGGRLPALARSRYAAAWSDDPLVRGLARASETPLFPAPADAGAWLAGAPAGGEHLGAVMEGDAHARRGRIEEWRELVARIERDWAAPLLAALEQRRLAGVTLRTGRGGDFRLTRRMLGRWWRRRRDLAAIVAAAP